MFPNDRSGGHRRVPGLRKLAEFSESEGGMMSYTTLVLMLFALALFFLVMNVGKVASEKVEVQNAADATATSSALWLARGLNVVTAVNHLMGEMMALVVAHESVGGRKVDGAELSRADLREARRYDRLLPRLRRLARRVGGWTTAYSDVIRPVHSAEMVGEGKINLKRALAGIYAAQIAAAAIFEGWGEVIVQALNFAELELLAEWRSLDVLERLARSSVPIKEFLRVTALPAAKAFEDEVVRVVPLLTAATAVRVASLDDTEGAITPPFPRLPVVQEPFDAADRDHVRAMGHSQIVRATFPWVNHDREPLLVATAWMVFSRASSLYRDWTDRNTTGLPWEYYRAGHSRLHVLEDSARDRKGDEPWTTDSRLADRRFAVVGFARREPYSPFGTPWFSRQNRRGIAAYAMALVYNASSQDPRRRRDGYQPEVGWDTLNWEPPVGSSFAHEFPEGKGGAAGQPRIRLNWQAKLVPVSSRINDSLEVLPPSFAGVFTRILPVPATLRTH